MRILIVLLIAILATTITVWRLAAGRRRRPLAPPPELKALIPASCFIEIDDVRIHYVQAGRGRDLVLLHGIGASVYVWRFLFPLLETHFRVTALDLPGFGKSSKHGGRDYGLDAQAVTMKSALGLIGIEKPILVGSSMGGALALWMGKVYPESFQTIVALAPATDPRLVPGFAHRLGALTPLLRRALNRHTMRLILKQVIVRHELIDRDAVDNYLTPFLDRGESVRAFWAATRLIADPRLPAELAGLEARVLLIYGDRDLRVPRRVMAQLQTYLPNATLLRHAGGGHHIMEDQPAWTAETIVKFTTEKMP